MTSIYILEENKRICKVILLCNRLLNSPCESIARWIERASEKMFALTIILSLQNILLWPFSIVCASFHLSHLNEIIEVIFSQCLLVENDEDKIESIRSVKYGNCNCLKVCVCVIRGQDKINNFIFDPE